MQRHSRILLSDGLDRNRVHDLAQAEDWILVDVVDEDIDHGVPFEIVWTDSLKTSTVHYFEDSMLGLSYLVVRGPDQTVAELLRDRLPIVTLESALTMLRDADQPADVALGIGRVAVAAGHGCDHRVTEAFRDTLVTPVPAVRNAAIFAMGYVEWPELVPLLEDVASNDDDAGVRASARLMLEAFAESAES